MLNPDEIIEDGFSRLRDARPRRSPAELAIKARKEASRARIMRSAAAATVFVAVTCLTAVALKPESAIAALNESARRSAAQPIIHMFGTSQDDPADPASPPWPQPLPEDIWRFPDRYIRKGGHVVTEQRKDGTILSYDNRFRTGYRSTYDAAKDRFWTFDGTIRVELSGEHHRPPSVQTAVVNGTRLTDYEWHDTDVMGNKTTSHVYVDPNTKLVRSAHSDLEAPNGDMTHISTVLEYPDAVTAKREIPHFPTGLRFRTKEELLQQFNREIGHPDQFKTIGGIRATLYGVVIYSNVPDGLGVDVITTGGAGPDYGSRHPPEVLSAKLLAVKRTQWFPQHADWSHIRFGHKRTFGGRSYIVNQSDDLLLTAPSRITVRVPVWRLGGSHNFVGYVTFTTSKIYCNTGDSSWSFYGDPHTGQMASQF